MKTAISVIASASAIGRKETIAKQLKKNIMETDWKKKYEEALARFRAFKDKYYTPGETDLGDVLYDKTGKMQSEFDAIFPELAESDDERIRNALICGLSEGLSEHNWQGFGGATIDECLAWLEKQKEQKPRKFKLGDKVHWHDDDMNVITIIGFRDDAYLTDSAYGPILFCDEDNWERIEQKPVEKQDYSGLNDLERAIFRGFLVAGVENVPVGIIKDTASECIGFLALIDDKPAEWSEEDESFLDSIEDAISSYYDLNHAPQYHYWLEEKLKSLRPSWKPSEEQMKALNALNCYGALSYVDQQNHLISLYNDLKKLCK